jgi:hypothetical protein
MTPASVSSAALVLIIPLVLWRLYARTRRLVGRQRSRLWRHWTAAVLWPMLLALLALGTIAHPTAEAALAAGIVTGVALAVRGLKLTRFVATAEGFFYTPNARIGIALSLLLAVRIVYRMVELYTAGGAPRAAPQDFTRSPLTLLILGMLAGYYASYAVGMLRWRRARRRAAGREDGGSSQA